jgi:polyisoprenyl-phosphate glycosyltransferase
MSVEIQPTEPTPVVTVVAPLFNEQENVAELHRRLGDVLQSLGMPYEVLLIDDGSRDSTPRLIDELVHQDRHVAAVHLSRNFGHQAAVSAGIDHARGRAVIVMDGDLQDPPEVLPRFVQKWLEGYEVVYAVRQRRKEGPLKRLGYFCFYRLLGAISDLDIPLDSGDFCLMDRQVVDVLKHLPEKMRFVRGLRSFAGFRQVGLAYERAAREGGKPKYTLGSLLVLAIDGLINFSNYPLRLVFRQSSIDRFSKLEVPGIQEIPASAARQLKMDGTLVTYLGLVTICIALALLVWVVSSALYNRTVPQGWASTLVTVLFMGSIQLFSLGIIGEYIRLIFLETKRRPTYIVRDYQGDIAGHPEAKGFGQDEDGQTGAVQS